MKKFPGRALTLLTVLVIGIMASHVAAAGEIKHHVVGAAEIQARIDQQLDRDGASRQAIRTALQRPDVQAIAKRAGLDITRASDAVAVLSGSELEVLADRANEINAGVGGSGNIVISTTALIIILLIIIIVAN